jgi:hypothetical protein
MIANDDLVAARRDWVEGRLKYEHIDPHGQLGRVINQVADRVSNSKGSNMLLTTELKALDELLGPVYEETKGKCERQIKAAESGFGGIDADLWKARLAENERLRRQYIPEYRPRSA